MGKIHQCLTELSACDMTMAGYYSLIFLLVADKLPAHHVLLVLFVCVEVLPPSQPNGVMFSVVSLPNHMFSGQA